MFEARKVLGHLDCKLLVPDSFSVMLVCVNIVFNTHYFFYFSILLPPEVKYKIGNNFQIFYAYEAKRT